MGVAAWLLRACCAMFYIVSPSDLALGAEDAAPTILLDYGIPMFFIMIAVERICMFFRKAPPSGASGAEEKAGGGAAPLPTVRLNDLVISTMLGAFQVGERGARLCVLR